VYGARFVLSDVTGAVVDVQGMDKLNVGRLVGQLLLQYQLLTVERLVAMEVGEIEVVPAYAADWCVSCA
jgi:hypothetical protein